MSLQRSVILALMTLVLSAQALAGLLQVALVGVSGAPAPAVIAMVCRRALVSYGSAVRCTLSQQAPTTCGTPMPSVMRSSHRRQSYRAIASPAMK